jgi:hypothetical protein
MEASGTATGTSRKKTAFYARKEDLPEELRLKFEEWQNRSSQRHPLYEREAGSYGKVPRGVEVVYKPPEFRKAGNLCVVWGLRGCSLFPRAPRALTPAPPPRAAPSTF